ncbi:hypothetical protein [Natrononativus amylolyticus]|uniref:hypothetical protein n=1 Tax=Natrononativus amylolyticus TaxID=2963434 RepID=UPI0020CC0C92|nr:hypothetical protein [Natrononativus amylolyticus]
MSNHSVWNEKVKQDPDICLNCFTWLKESYTLRGVMTKLGDPDSAKTYTRNSNDPTNSVKERAIRRQRRRIRGPTVEFDGDGRKEDEHQAAQYNTYPVCECGVDHHEVVYKEELTHEELKGAVVEIGKKLTNDRRVNLDRKQLVVDYLRLRDSTRPEDQFASSRHLLKHVVDSNAEIVDYEPQETEFVYTDRDEKNKPNLTPEVDLGEVDNSHLPDLDQDLIEVTGRSSGATE